MGGKKSIEALHLQNKVGVIVPFVNVLDHIVETFK